MKVDVHVWYKTMKGVAKLTALCIHKHGMALSYCSLFFFSNN